jgi:hypothetical protein
MKITEIAAFILCLTFALSLSACQTTDQTGFAPTAVTPPSSSAAAGNVVWQADGVITPGEYPHQASYDNGNYTLYWKTGEQYIYLGIQAKTAGFVAAGIQPGITMKDADILFGFVSNGTATVTDEYSTGNFGPHQPDTDLGGKYNILESGGKEQDNITTIELKRLLDTGDQYDHPLQPGANKIIWSYGPDDSSQNHHSARGYGEISVQE